MSFSVCSSRAQRVVILSGLAFFLLGLSSSAQAAAVEGSAPALSNVESIVLQSVRVGGTTNGVGNVTNACSIARGEIDTALIKILKNYGLPITVPQNAKPAHVGFARIDLVPEVVTSNNQDSSECTTWISLSAQTNSTVRIPPVETPRNVVVTYWRGGLLVTSSPTANGRAINDALDKLARQLSQQYKLDQPPELPDLTTDEQKRDTPNK